MKNFCLINLLVIVSLHTSKAQNIVGLEVGYGLNTFFVDIEEQIRRDMLVYPIRGLFKLGFIESGVRNKIGFNFGHELKPWIRLEGGISFLKTGYKFLGIFNINQPRFSPNGDMEFPVSPTRIEGKISHYHLEPRLGFRVYFWKGRIRTFTNPFVGADILLSNTREQLVRYENGSIENQVGLENFNYPAVWYLSAGAGLGLEYRANKNLEISLIVDVGITLSHYRRDEAYQPFLGSGDLNFKIGYYL